MRFLPRLLTPTKNLFRNAVLALAFSAVAGLLAGPASAANVPVAKCQIVTPATTNHVVDFAAAELSKHLAMVGGAAVTSGTAAQPGMYPIYVGIRPPDDATPLTAEEARWRITERGAWLYGDDAVTERGATPMATIVRYENRTGTLFAVYEFLERYLGVRWLAPGDAGIAFEKISALDVAPGQGNWSPVLQQRHIRPGYRCIGDRDPDGIEVRPLVLSMGNVPYGFIMPTDQFQQRREDEAVWHRRMRMGRSHPVSYGHAFLDWWHKYGQSNPEYFALNRFGKREPSPDIMQGQPDRIKLCVSNPDVVHEVVRRHFAGNGGPVVNACENDSRGFCRCERCLSWDVLHAGEEKTDIDRRHLTDRYLRFANAVHAEARKRNPAVKTAFYAYSQSKFPPRREKVADGVIVFFITEHYISDQELDEYYQAWKQAGAKEVYLRPNYLCDDTGMPLGFEQNIYDKFQLIRRHFPLAGTDFDCSWGFRPIAGIAEYITARAFYEPDQSFEHWEKEYCAAFGAAQDDILAYHRYWRQIWNARVMPNRARIDRISGQLKETRDKLMQLTDLLYAEEDFDRTDALLVAALGRELSPQVRTRVEELKLANQHSRLTYHTRKTNQIVSTATAEERAQATKALHAFRRAHLNDLDMYWEGLLYMENLYNDVGGYLRMSGRQGKRWADWMVLMAESIRKERAPNEPPLR